MLTLFDFLLPSKVQNYRPDEEAQNGRPKASFEISEVYTGSLKSSLTENLWFKINLFMLH